MAAKGHEDAFLRPRLSARCRFSQGTFAGTRGNGRDAPKADLAIWHVQSSQTSYSARLPRLHDRFWAGRWETGSPAVTFMTRNPVEGRGHSFGDTPGDTETVPST